MFRLDGRISTFVSRKQTLVDVGCFLEEICHFKIPSYVFILNLFVQ